MQSLSITIMLLAGAAFMLAFAAAMFVIFKFYALVSTLDSHLLRQFQYFAPPLNAPQGQGQPLQPDGLAGLNAALAANRAATDGAFETMTDSEAFLREMEKEQANVVGHALSPEEAELLHKSAIGIDV